MAIICKFGGSSLSQASQIKKVKAILDENTSRSVIVVSAPGKDKDHPTKLTDLLLLLFAHVEYGINYDHILKDVESRYQDIIDGLNIPSKFSNLFDAFKKEINQSMSKDYLVSRGEYFMALILSEYLEATFVDAKDLICVSYDGSVDYEETAKRVTCLEEVKNRVVIPGFYASTKHKQIKLFNRGGSDLTASLLARTLNMQTLENWTDVNGLCVVDPKIVKEPKQIKAITFLELRELSYRGATVLQQESIIPLEQTDVCVHIKNTNNPNEEETLISRNVDKNNDIITGLSGSKDFSSLTFIKDNNHSFSKILNEVIKGFHKYHLTIEHMPTGIDTFSIITKTTPLKQVYFDLLSEFHQIEGIVDVTSEDNIALVAIVGRNMSKIPGVAGKIFSTLGKHNINIKVIAQASKEISIIIGVDNHDYENALQVLYDEFYGM